MHSIHTVIIAGRPLWSLGLQCTLSRFAPLCTTRIAQDFNEGERLIAITNPKLLIVEREAKGFSNTFMERYASDSNHTAIIFAVPQNARSGYGRIEWADAIITDAITPCDILKLVKRLCPDSQKPIEQLLTDRELEIAGLIAEGYRTTEIATALYISSNTVKTHLAHIREKLGVFGRLGIAQWYHTRTEVSGC